MKSSTSILTLFLLLTVCLYFALSPEPGRDKPIEKLPPAHVPQKEAGPVVAKGYFAPANLPFSEERMKSLKVPPGFTLGVFARNVGNPALLAVAEDGTVFASRPTQGDVVTLTEPDASGEAQKVTPVVSGLGSIFGIAVRGNTLYLATTRTVYAAKVRKGGGVDTPQPLVRNLPEGGIHANRTVAVGPDGLLYIAVGSQWNAAPDKNPEDASILQVRPDGSGRKVFASGLGTTLGMAWHPITRQMWAVEQGTDWTGLDDFPLEELNRIVPGHHYGWPWCNGKRMIDPMTPGKPGSLTKEDFCLKTEPSVMTFQAHSGPISLVFHNGRNFPKGYRNDAYLALHGSIFRKEPVGYKVVHIHFENGQPVGMEDFLSGFLADDGKSQFGMPSGVAVAKDGSLLVSSENNGMIYRIYYTP